VRDYVLGATLLNGQAELLSFGGQVMKNVAGYDVSRMLAGSMGVLGVICEVSLKVLPVPPATATLRFDLDQATPSSGSTTGPASPAAAGQRLVGRGPGAAPGRGGRGGRIRHPQARRRAHRAGPGRALLGGPARPA
jgi:hypothetical protein